MEIHERVKDYWFAREAWVWKAFCLLVAFTLAILGALLVKQQFESGAFERIAELSALKAEILGIERKLADSNAESMAYQEEVRASKAERFHAVSTAFAEGEKAANLEFQTRLSEVEAKLEIAKKDGFEAGQKLASEELKEQLNSEKMLRREAETNLNRQRKEFAEISYRARQERDTAVADARRQAEEAIGRLKDQIRFFPAPDINQRQNDLQAPTEQRCLENGKLATMDGSRPLITCVGSHLITLSRLTNSAYISVDDEDRQNIRVGDSATYPGGCKIALHVVREADPREADIAVVCK